MTKDLEETLNELGPEYWDVVARLQGCTVPPSALAGGAVTAGLGIAAAFGCLASLGCCEGARRYGVWLRAAALALLLFLPCAILTRSGPSSLKPTNPYRLAETATPAAVAELVRTQHADGSWETDFLTRRNAQALKGQPGVAAQLAYRRAVRNLRLRGLL